MVDRMKVKEIMSSPAFTVGPDATLEAVASLMAEKNIGAVPVVDAGGRLLGLLTEGDFTGVTRAIPFNLKLAPVIFGARAATAAELKSIFAKARVLPARQVMSEGVLAAREDDPLGALIQRMLADDLKHVPVVRDGRVVGMVARHDLLKALLTKAD